MSRRVLSGLALALFWVEAAQAAWPDGVLNYCGFEGFWDEAGWRDLEWNKGGTPGVSFDRIEKRFGRTSLRIEGAPGATRGVMQLDGDPVKPGTKYVLRVWVKTKSVAERAEVAVLAHSAAGPLAFVDLGERSRLSGTHGWTLREIPLPRLPENAIRVYPYLWVKGTGTAWFDEFSLARSGTAVPLGGQKIVTDADYAGLRFQDAGLPGNLLPNPGFEDGLSGWFVESGKPRIDEATAAAGRRSLRCDGYPQCNYCVVQGRVRIDPRRAYRFSVELKTDLAAGLSCIQFIPFKANGEGFGWWFTQDHTYEFCYGRGRQDWHEESLVLRRFPPETDYVNVYLLLQDAVGTAWFDSVRLAPLSTAETKKAQLSRP
jgi:hypothetical protein